ncbi:hypothetical protein GUJ93_ZPchr0013g35516 [Zizania palustris]|uniref:Uncharacterized protein n=1 Tax=Zizania palustris TaxID=103762 RepID=A0A8J5WRF2_ZIZPA|nr:hypothetical protein GUJ93_ZPchr0013g35516 [Zizania palustris]
MILGIYSTLIGFLPTGKRIIGSSCHPYVGGYGHAEEGRGQEAMDLEWGVVPVADLGGDGAGEAADLGWRVALAGRPRVGSGAGVGWKNMRQLGLGIGMRDGRMGDGDRMGERAHGAMGLHAINDKHKGFFAKTSGVTWRQVEVVTPCKMLSKQQMG